MGRIRSIKPEFFTHDELYEAEMEYCLPLRVAFSGLWCASDKEGRFKWRPKQLKLAILPYDDVDFSRALDALETRGFIVKYENDGEFFGYIPSWKEHQVINNRESESILPNPTDSNSNITRAKRVNDASSTPLCNFKGEREGKGKEGEEEGKGEGIVVDEPVDPPVTDNLPIPNFDEVKNAWNMFAEANGLAQVRELTKQRKIGIKTRLNERGFDAEEIFREIQKSSFLRGKNDRGWKVDFDFVFCSPNKWVNIVEGKYRDNGTSGGKLTMEELWNELN